jgi:zinc ribbon protein
MEDRFCPSCGTEVEAGARFCPTCGTTLSQDGEDPGPPTQTQAELPPAPAWPPPDEPSVQPAAAPEAEAPEAEPPEPAPAEAASPEAESVPPPPSPSPGGGPGASTARGPDLPITWPTMLSGWLIGGGSLLGALALIPRLGNVVSLLLFLALVGIAATVFLADRVPDVPRQRLVILVVSMIGLGVGLARAGFSVQGTETVFLVAMLAAAGGALLIELDRDRPMPPPERSA